MSELFSASHSVADQSSGMGCCCVCMFVYVCVYVCVYIYVCVYVCACNRAGVGSFYLTPVLGTGLGTGSRMADL